MYFDGADEDFEPRKRRRCRTSKKKRLRLKQRASLEPKEEGPQRHQSENNQQLANETRKESGNQEKEPSQAQEDIHESKPQRQQEGPEQVDDGPEGDHGDGDGEDEEMTEYERKRRTNILRNQAWMQQLGFSAAKLAVRTAIGIEATKSTAKRQKSSERQVHRAAEQPTQPLRKSKRVRRATDVMNVARQPTRSYRRQKRTAAKTKRFFYIEESESELSSYEEGSTEEEEDDFGGESTEEEKMEEPSDESGTEEDEMEEPAHESEVGDSRPKEHVQSIEPPTEPLVEPKAQTSNDRPSDSLDDKQQAEVNQAETEESWSGSAFQSVEPLSSVIQANEREILHDAENNSALGGMADFERKRRANILRNQAFMQQVGVSITKLAARTSIGDEAGKEARRQELAAKRALKAAQRATLSSQQVRKSRRQAGEKAVLGHQPALNYSLELLSMRTKRNRAVDLMDAVDDDGKAFLKDVASSSTIPSAFEIDSFEGEVEYSLAKTDAVKIVPFRTTSMAFLPRADCIFLACGDKEGHIGFWSPSQRVHDATGGNTPSPAALFRPHGFTVSQIVFPDLSTMLSSSFHGVVQEFDLHTAESSLVCDINAEAGISSLLSTSSQAFYAGCTDGKMRLVDRRARGTQRYELHEGSINSLDRHPSLTFCIATASNDRTVCLWDMRRLSSHMSIPLTTIPHATIVDCAHFSPHDGNWLVSVTDEDSHINMIDTSILMKRNESDPLPIPLPSPIRIYHKGVSPSNTTGSMRATWDPKTANRFVIGCVGAPSRLNIFSAHRPVRELKSANFVGTNAVNIFHPYLDLIASGNGGGRISLWRGSSKKK